MPSLYIEQRIKDLSQALKRKAERLFRENKVSPDKVGRDSTECKAVTRELADIIHLTKEDRVEHYGYCMQSSLQGQSAGKFIQEEKVRIQKCTTLAKKSIADPAKAFEFIKSCTMQLRKGRPLKEIMNDNNMR